MALAELSEDTALKQALLGEGRDFHAENAAAWLNKGVSDVSPRERKLAKTLTFQLTYGAGAKSMSESMGIIQGEASNFIYTFYSSYPQVHAWQLDVLSTLNLTAHDCGDREMGQPMRRSYYTNALTGRKLLFVEQVSKYTNNNKVQFSYTKAKNYPVQSFATGDIVPECLGRLAHRVLTRDKENDILLCSTTHDSVLLDIRKDELGLTIQLLKEALDVRRWMKARFNATLSMSYPIEIEVGHNWKNMVVLKFKNEE